MHVSHETIYRSLFIQARRVLKKELTDHLRSKQRMRRSRHASEHGHSRGQIVDAISIRERPAEAEDRAIPGHWEGDLLAGGKNSYIATLVERHSRFLMLIKVPSKGKVLLSNEFHTTTFLCCGYEHFLGFPVEDLKSSLQFVRAQVLRQERPRILIFENPARG
jgi:IS30 family transposase